MHNFIKCWHNARTVVQQIKKGEWVPRFNPLNGSHLVAERDGLALWIGNGCWFCDMYQSNPAFGLVFRHYVWWAAARKLKAGADASLKPAVTVPDLRER